MFWISQLSSSMVSYLLPIQVCHFHVLQNILPHLLLGLPTVLLPAGFHLCNFFLSFWLYIVITWPVQPIFLSNFTGFTNVSIINYVVYFIFISSPFITFPDFVINVWKGKIILRSYKNETWIDDLSFKKKLVNPQLICCLWFFLICKTNSS